MSSPSVRATAPLGQYLGQPPLRLFDILLGKLQGWQYPLPYNEVPQMAPRTIVEAIRATKSVAA